MDVFIAILVLALIAWACLNPTQNRGRPNHKSRRNCTCRTGSCWCR